MPWKATVVYVVHLVDGLSGTCATCFKCIMCSAQAALEVKGLGLFTPEHKGAKRYTEAWPHHLEAPWAAALLDLQHVSNRKRGSRCSRFGEVPWLLAGLRDVTWTYANQEGPS